MAVFLSPVGNGDHWLGANALPANAGLINTYLAGTTTPAATWTTSAGNIANTNPIVLTPAGIPPSEIWLTGGTGYKFVITDVLGVQIGPTYDNLYGIGDLSSPIVTTFFGFSSPFNFMTPAQIADWQSGAGAFDHSAFIQDAINTLNNVYLPAGSPTIKSTITCANKGQIIGGAGRSNTFLFASGGAFVTGIFNVTSGENGPDFRDFCIQCAQPSNPANYAALNTYPPVFYLNATPRVRMRDLRICMGIDGVYQNGNCGGFIAERVESSCFGHNWYVDGNLDVTQWIDCQVWPFTATSIMTTGQQTVFITSGNCYGVYSGRCDYFEWVGGLFLCGQSANFVQTASGNTYGSFTNTGFDTFGGLTVAAGQITATGCNYSIGGILGAITLPNQNAAAHTGTGILNIVGGNVQVGTSSTVGHSACFYSNGTGGGMTIIGVDAALTAADPVSFLNVAATDTSLIRVENNGTLRVGTGAYTVPILNIQGGFGAIVGNTCLPNVNATGDTNFLEIAGTVQYNVRGNLNNNWGIVVTGSTVATSNVISIPPIFGDAMPVVTITGNVQVNGITYTTTGIPAPFAGQIVTLQSTGTPTIGSGVVGTVGNPILNGRGNFAMAANSTITLQLMANGNWFEIGRCA